MSPSQVVKAALIVTWGGAATVKTYGALSTAPHEFVARRTIVYVPGCVTDSVGDGEDALPTAHVVVPRLPQLRLLGVTNHCQVTLQLFVRLVVFVKLMLCGTHVPGFEWLNCGTRAGSMQIRCVIESGSHTPAVPYASNSTS